MKKPKIKLNKRDFHRALLTDVLPYEVPFIHTNEGFYSAAKPLKGSKSIIQSNNVLSEIFDNSTKKETHPLTYKIAKDNTSNRELYLVHPIAQLDIVELYKNYNQLITHLCTRSSYSLRFPKKIAYAYYSKEKDTNPEDKFKDEGVSIESIDEPVYASTFFEYKEFGFLYKFYDSYSFHRIEKKFNFLFKFDIAKCFSSISTFQLPKSIRDIHSYNNSRGLYSFEAIFENLMNNSHYGNSHGIVVGPEFSRIFAEILLQSIDVEIKTKLINYKNEFGKKCSIIENTDYVIKRYVDDFFLFYNSEEIRDIVYKISTETLEKYRLYYNESKNKVSSVPFITGITIAKQNYKELLSDFFSCFSTVTINEKEIQGINRNLNYYYRIANNLITDVKCIIYNNEVPYSSITGYYFTLTRIKISEIDALVDDIILYDEQCDKLTNFLLIIIEVSFFMYSMDYRVRSTYLISQIIILINRISEKLSTYHKDRIKKKIYDESYSAIKSALNKKSLRNIESLNLLIAIRDIDIEYQLSIDEIRAVIGLDQSDTTPCYFNLMTCLFYIQNKRKFFSVRKEVVNIILNKFNQENLSIFNDSELIHLFFDSLRCPYITKKQKYKIINSALDKNIFSSDNDFEEFFSLVSNRNWFIDWDTNSDQAIEKLLMKKELKTPYSD
ncbi:antiviral reverse transcriptase Drt3b [Aliivibrio fischeri]|uniref:antiviral reverse transcriptase Drt3b n=1 Tax=Aliivibrio fischeri TaxID=668 RepID=UPI00084C23BC|nr:antiviral reverse transcriptase Drt3b [Aliivibrio fischeri]OED55773.1 hypothetical protein BEI46_09725 [Aliivibrio fischeri]